MTIKEILKNDKLLSNYIIEVNCELYDEYKHGFSWIKVHISH